MQFRAFFEKLIYKVLWSRRLMYKWVAWCLQYRVRSGFFRGMRYWPIATWGNPGNKLLGIYERELLPCWEIASLSHPKVIFDIGAAEGYYAVGFATKWSDSEVFAWEMDESSQKQLVLNAQANQVDGRIHLLGACDEPSLYDFILLHRPNLILMDVEGAELDLCSARCLSAALNAIWVIECHSESIIQTLAARFSASHQSTIILNQPRSAQDAADLLPSYCLLLPNDLLRLVNEGRPFPTPWLFATPSFKD